MKSKNNISYTSPHILASLPKGTPVLLAYSGGADSSALLHLLYKDSKEKGFQLHAAHFNHLIRAEEADRDAEFCRSTCQSLNIPFYLGCADVPRLAKENGKSLEMEAREQRYAFFEKIMTERNIPILVTAHHAEDQIESILLHLIRGSGISGLCGMASCRPLCNGLLLARPILSTEKEDILAYCAKNNIAFVTDSTNCDTAYSRNFIRAEITPRMKELQPNLCEIFERLSENARQTNDFVNSAAISFIEGECQNGIPLSKFNELHPTLKARVLDLAFEAHSSGASLESVHIKAVILLCERGKAHSSLSLPNMLAAKIENDLLLFAEDKQEYRNEDYDVPFAVGKINLPCGVIINVEKNPVNTPTPSHAILEISCDAVGNGAHLRPRREGDVILSGKMNKKAKKLISEKKIPLDMRKKLPLLVCEDEILWIPTVASCDRVKNEKLDPNADFYRITVSFED